MWAYQVRCVGRALQWQLGTVLPPAAAARRYRTAVEDVPEVGAAGKEEWACVQACVCAFACACVRVYV